jgi:hypothetical protein
VHRTAGSQVLGPNSSLRVYRSRDDGRHFALQAIIPAPVDRDIRDPSFYSSPLAGDPSWLEGFQGQTDIWQATLDLSKLRSPDSHTAAALRQHTPA